MEKPQMFLLDSFAHVDSLLSLFDAHITRLHLHHPILSHILLLLSLSMWPFTYMIPGFYQTLVSTNFSGTLESEVGTYLPTPSSFCYPPPWSLMSPSAGRPQTTIPPLPRSLTQILTIRSLCFSVSSSEVPSPHTHVLPLFAPVLSMKLVKSH